MVLALFIAFLFLGCAEAERDNPQDPKASNYDPSLIKVSYGGRTYKIVVIGSQTWMAENLNYEVSGECYGDDPSNCATYGRLYDWATAMNLPSSCNTSTCSDQINNPHRGICPEGWHLPSKAEWDALESYVERNSGCSGCSEFRLKATSGWNHEGNGTDNYGFSALPGGYSGCEACDSYFDDVGDYGWWWLASEHNATGASHRFMYHGFGLSPPAFSSRPKNLGFSVRCIKD